MTKRQAITRMRNIPAVMIIIGIILLVLGVFLPSTESFFSASTGIIIILSSVGVELLSYLQKGSVLSIVADGSGPIAEEKIAILTNELSNIKTQINRLEKHTIDTIFSDEDKLDIKDAIIKQMPVLEVEKFVMELSDDIIKKSNRETATNFTMLYGNLVDSLERQISNLGRRANTNLVMGSITTVSGLLALAYFIVSLANLSPLSGVQAAIFFVTRLTLVTFIEVFAYFFLRLYRYSIFEIKYFQNEITNARFKIIAVEASYRNERLETLDKICLEFAKTERNFILKKGETTVSLRQNENDMLADKAVENLLKKVLAGLEDKT